MWNLISFPTTVAQMLSSGGRVTSPPAHPSLISTSIATFQIPPPTFCASRSPHMPFLEPLLMSLPDSFFLASVLCTNVPLGFVLKAQYMSSLDTLWGKLLHCHGCNHHFHVADSHISFSRLNTLSSKPSLYLNLTFLPLRRLPTDLSLKPEISKALLIDTFCYFSLKIQAGNTKFWSVLSSLNDSLNHLSHTLYDQAIFLLKIYRWHPIT